MNQEEIESEAFKSMLSARSDLMWVNRFFYYILNYLPIRPSLSVPTVGIGFFKETNAIEIRYNPKFLVQCQYTHPVTKVEMSGKFKPEDIQNILIHEVLHLCLAHLEPRHGVDKMTLNIAQDIVINDMILRTKAGYGPKDYSKFEFNFANMCVTKFDFEATKDLHIEDYPANKIYDLIKNDQEKIDKIKQAMGEGYVFSDEHGEIPDNAEGDAGQQEALKMSKEEIQGKIKHIMQESAKKTDYFGNLPNELLKKLDMYKNKPDFRDTLNHFIKNCKTDIFKSTWKKPSRRYGLIAKGTTSDFKPRILVGVDSSGSVFGHPDALKKIAEYFSFALEYCEKIHLIYCDTVIHLDKQFQQGDTIPDIHGGGGTMLQPIFDRAEQEEFDGTILITDGYCDNIDTKGVPHLALIVPDGQKVPGIAPENHVYFEKSKN
jgi:predicted metal-dependent peptidase